MPPTPVPNAVIVVPRVIPVPVNIIPGTIIPEATEFTVNVVPAIVPLNVALFIISRT